MKLLKLRRSGKTRKLKIKRRASGQFLMRQTISLLLEGSHMRFESANGRMRNRPLFYICSKPSLYYFFVCISFSLVFQISYLSQRRHRERERQRDRERWDWQIFERAGTRWEEKRNTREWIERAKKKMPRTRTRASTATNTSLPVLFLHLSIPSFSAMVIF